MRPATTHVAAALAFVTLAAAPAAAEEVERDQAVQQAIAGAALIGLFALALRDDEEDEKDDDGDRRRNAPPAGDHWRDWTPPGRWEREQDRAALPASCLRLHETARGAVRVFDGDCLGHRYRGARALPFDCAILLDGRRRLVSGYVPRCLGAHGFEFADR